MDSQIDTVLHGTVAKINDIIDSVLQTGVQRVDDALYELDSAEVVDSPAWLEAGERGDWAPKIRPHTSNRSHTIMRRVG